MIFRYRIKWTLIESKKINKEQNENKYDWEHKANIQSELVLIIIIIVLIKIIKLLTACYKYIYRIQYFYLFCIETNKILFISVIAFNSKEYRDKYNFEYDPFHMNLKEIYY